jgi:predicted tellurium resistance membrane protein TerC
MEINAESLIALLTLTLLEVVLGIDNIIFIAILVGKLPEKMRNKARQIGLSLAMIMRIGLLLSITWIMKLTEPWFYIPFLPAPEAHGAAGGHGAVAAGAEAAATAIATTTAAAAHAGLPVSGKALILLLGGLFLIGKSTFEIHDKLEGDDHHGGAKKPASFASAIIQILLLDLVFSLDSVITAVGMAKHLWVMITAVVIAVGLMLVFSGYIVRFVERHPTIKILALSFLILIGVMLVAEGLGRHIEKGYIYFAMAFAVAVEMLNIQFRKKSSKPLHLHHSSAEPQEPPVQTP